MMENVTLRVCFTVQTTTYNTEVLFGPLDDFGRPNWGCTDIKVDGEFLGGG